MDNNENNDFQQINDENELDAQRRAHRDEVRKQREEEQQEKKKNIKGTIDVIRIHGATIAVMAGYPYINSISLFLQT